ncbi:MAG: hypothetical protein JSW25_03885, partial [Thermoplasmata archaeon]
MLAACPGCGITLEDTGTSGTITCPRCGTTFASMSNVMGDAESPGLRRMAQPPPTEQDHPP